MDDFIDLELEKIDLILKKLETDPEPDDIKRVEIDLWNMVKEKCINGRRTGLGITAEGDMIAAMNLRYGTVEANNFAALVHRTLKLEAYRESVNLAKERGAFPIYDYKREENNPFICRIKNEDPELYADMVKYGRRNIALLTIAPTGTVSLMTQTTSGIEPVFMPIYKRRRKKLPHETKVDFVDTEGVEWTEFIVFHHKFKEYLKIKGIENPEDMSADEVQKLVEQSPYHKATANDVDWVMKVEMQGLIQREVDHSINILVA